MIYRRLMLPIEDVLADGTASKLTDEHALEFGQRKPKFFHQTGMPSFWAKAMTKVHPAIQELEPLGISFSPCARLGSIVHYAPKSYRALLHVISCLSTVLSSGLMATLRSWASIEAINLPSLDEYKYGATIPL